MNFAIFSAEHVECLKCWVCMASSDEAESSCWSESRLSGDQVCSTEEFEAMVKPHGCLHPFLSQLGVLSLDKIFWCIIFLVKDWRCPELSLKMDDFFENGSFLTVKSKDWGWACFLTLRFDLLLMKKFKIAKASYPRILPLLIIDEIWISVKF